jgi:hypothetical protein
VHVHKGARWRVHSSKWRPNGVVVSRNTCHRIIKILCLEDELCDLHGEPLFMQVTMGHYYLYRQAWRTLGCQRTECTAHSTACAQAAANHRSHNMPGSNAAAQQQLNVDSSFTCADSISTNNKHRVACGTLDSDNILSQNDKINI